MGCSNYSPSDLCGESILAQCVKFEDPNQSIIPSISSLSGQTCATVDEVITDMYGLIEDNYIDMSSYVKDCLSLTNPTPLDVLNKLTEEVCLLKTLTADYADETVDIANLDLTCFAGNDPCGDPVSLTNLTDVIQLMIDKICYIEDNCCA